MDQPFSMTPPDASRPQPIRALGLLFGGLDSALAAAMLLEQGLEVVGLHLESPVSCCSDVREVTRDLGILLTVRSKSEECPRLLRDPRWGHGRSLNPCVDCRVFLLRRSRECLEESGADFLFTGEVPGQRPMSQRSEKVRLVDRRVGADGLILRPPSAKLARVSRSRPLAFRGWRPGPAGVRSCRNSRVAGRALMRGRRESSS